MPAPEPSLRERYVGAAGTRIFLREMGQGPPVWLLHGFPQTGRCWRHVAPLLAERHRVLVPDLPGYGRSERPLGYDAATLAGTLAALMANAEAPRAAVVGHDWGGSLAFRLALDHAARVEKLVVLNAPFRQIDYRRAWHMLAFNVPLLPEAALTLAGKRVMSFFLRYPSANRGAFGDDVVEEYTAAFGTLERRRSALAYYRTVTRANMRRALAATPLGRPFRPARATARRRIEAPTLLIWGARDPVLPLSLTEGIRRDIPRARVEVVDDAGHFVPEERPDAVAKLLLDFLAS